MELDDETLSMHRAQVRLNILMMLYVCLGILFSVPIASSSNISPFGSVLAGLIYLDEKGSDVIPQATLRHEGILTGTGPSNQPTKLAVVRSSEEAYEIIGTGKPALTFVASYDSFLLFLMDLDGDGVDEVFLENSMGLGRGMFVYVRQLRIFRISPEGLEEVFGAELNGYDDFDGEVKGYIKKYRLIRDIETGGVSVELTE